MSLAEQPISLSSDATDLAIEPCVAAPLAPATRRLIRAALAPQWDSDTTLAVLAAIGVVRLDDRLDVATRAARLLGEQWVADTCSFADVTLGLHRLTQLLFALEERSGARPVLHGGGVLLAAMPDDQHGFGLGTVALALRQGGWDVTLDLAGDADRLCERVGRQSFDCIGLSIGYDRAAERAGPLIDRLRRAAGVRGTMIAVGGPMLARRPHLARDVGADLSAPDGFALAALLNDKLRARAA